MIELHATYGQISSGQSCAKVVTSRFFCGFISRWFLGRVFGNMATITSGTRDLMGILRLTRVTLPSLELLFSGLPVLCF